LVRALLACAATAAAIALAGCDVDGITPTGRANAPLSEKMVKLIDQKNMDKNSPILVRLFKEESELEVWKKDRNGEYALLQTYPICRWSGDLGPKKKEGDRQAPEGFYTITPAQMNPKSAYFLSFNTGYPNAYDRSHGYTGSELMVHGDCSSRGCYAMTDEQIQEIYALARDSFFGGQKEFQLEALPFRLTALNMAKHRDNPNFAFWKMLKEGYDHFEATKQEPKVAVCEKHYVFDAAAPDNATKALAFSPAGKCPVYQLDKNIADVVLDHRRQEQYKLAEYIAEGVATVPSRAGIDGGMNPVFAAKLQTHDEFDSNGRIVQVAGNNVAPGALPRADAPVTTVTVPQTPPESQAGDALAQKQPAASGGLLGNLFGGSKTEAKAADESAQPVALRGSKTETAGRPKHTAARATSAPAQKPKETEKPKAAANAAPAPQPKQTAQEEVTVPAPPLRSAYANAPANSNGMLTGAQPVVPVGTFDNRWAGLR
jgi:murein L,D-transpeptidase YafK